MSQPFIISLRVPADANPDRLDRWLANQLTDPSTDSPEHVHGASQLPVLSRSRVKNLILDGMLNIDGQCVKDPSFTVSSGQTCTLTVPESAPATPIGQSIEMDILYEDAYIIVIDKPAGLVVHPAPGTPDGTLVNALIAHCGDQLTGIGGEKRPGIVHRLDKDTSGVMMAAKTDIAHQKLTEMFAAHDLDRIYTALAWGIVREREQTIDAPIGRSNRDRKKMAITEKGREAITHLQVVRSLPPLASVLECRLETGRTHQIRVHLASIGHGIIGDPAYGRPMRSGQMPDTAMRDALTGLRAFKRQALHASHLGFAHPVTRELMEFTTPLPQDMQDLIQNLENAIRARGLL
ncbi:MAG: RluA family pseudouridine synthase [Alphaproteobacteria bacterium]|nr:RluA family pseudouridine synthase [Alphaproteobacteria bacterium]